MANTERQKDAYTINEAVMQILNLQPDDIEEHDGRSFFKSNVAEALAQFFYQAMQNDYGSYSMMLAGHIVNNPHNALTRDEIKFPRRAYFDAWKTDPRGLSCPEWFLSEINSRYERITGKQLKPGENAPDDFKKAVEEDTDWLYFDDVKKAIEEDTDRLYFDEVQPVASAEKPAANDGELLPGLTVKDARAVLKEYPLLFELIAAAVEVAKYPANGIQQKTAGGLVSLASRNAQKHCEQWGRGVKGEFSTAQKEQFETLFLKAGKGGRPAKDAVNEKGRLVLCL